MWKDVILFIDSNFYFVKGIVQLLIQNNSYMSFFLLLNTKEDILNVGNQTVAGSH